jgi:hypothetical protein
VSGRRLALSGALALGIAAPAAVALASSSHAGFWQNQAKTVVCGRAITARSFQLLCSAKGIPRPSTGGRVGDPFVVLRPTGKAQRVLLSQREFPAGHPATLGNGMIWSKDGIGCSLARRVTCVNTSGAGFTIGNGKYTAFSRP